MSANSKIAWTDHTFSPWRGCTKAGVGCLNCYAERWSKRQPNVFGTWGKDGKRVIASKESWRQPRVWNRRAEKRGVREIVFCASMADVFEERADLEPYRRALFGLIGETPCLNWILLTKRPEYASRWLVSSERPIRCPSEWRFGGRFPLSNLIIGTSVSNQAEADERLSWLVKCPAACLMVSLEPMLESVDVRRWLPCPRSNGTLAGYWYEVNPATPRVRWVAVGCESGPRRRPCPIEAVRSVVRQCREAGVSCFVKQIDLDGGVSHKMSEWPSDLQVQEWPEILRRRS